MTIYLVHADRDGESHLTELRIAADSTHDDMLPTLGWRAMTRPGRSEKSDFHVSQLNGSVQIVVKGALEIGVTAGAVRQVTGRPGDVFVFIDTKGRGHSGQRNSDDDFEAFNIRLTEDREAVRAIFANWPADAV